MLPFSMNVKLGIVEFFCIVILHVVYAFTQLGGEAALYTSIGFLPVLLTILLYRLVKKEKIIIRSFYITMLITSYIISLQLHTLGTLVFIFLAAGLMMALYADRRLMIEYTIVSALVLVFMGIFQVDLIEETCPSQIYYTYLVLYAFSTVIMIFMVSGIKRYKTQMELKNEEARNALEAKSNFLANMSHEIRTPMNAIWGMAELLNKEDLGEKENGYIETIKNSSESLLSIINEILDFSKIDSGNMEINEDEYHFNSLLHDVVSIIEFRMRGKSVKLKLDIDPKVPRVLIGDELRLRQILINLMNNAVNFTHRGYIALHISWRPTGDNTGVLDVSVEDTGIGISKENMNKLFKAFGQIDTRKNRNVEGTGLGLAISKNLLDLMGGEIWATSTEKKGSTFSFILPQKVKDARPSNYEQNHENVEKSNSSFNITFKAPTARVMIVDDNRVNLMVASELMKKFGIEPTLVESGTEAYNRIEEHLITYDIVFMDHMMPYMDGVETTIKIRELDTDYARELPIIALTANAIKGVERTFKAAGMDDYIAKPIHVKQLDAMLKKWIPFEKQVRIVDGTPAEPVSTLDTNTRKAENSNEDFLFELTGIDFESGIRNCGGSLPVYIKVLQTFSSSNMSASLQEYFEQQDMQNYGIIAHSIKGACRNIGAMAIADEAYELEKAGKEADFLYIQDHHEQFMEKYQGTMSTVTRALLGRN